MRPEFLPRSQTLGLVIPDLLTLDVRARFHLEATKFRPQHRDHRSRSSLLEQNLPPHQTIPFPSKLANAQTLTTFRFDQRPVCCVFCAKNFDPFGTRAGNNPRSKNARASIAEPLSIKQIPTVKNHASSKALIEDQRDPLARSDPIRIKKNR